MTTDFASRNYIHIVYYTTQLLKRRVGQKLNLQKFVCKFKRLVVRKSVRKARSDRHLKRVQPPTPSFSTASLPFSADTKVFFSRFSLFQLLLSTPLFWALISASITTVIKTPTMKAKSHHLRKPISSRIFKGLR